MSFLSWVDHNFQSVVFVKGFFLVMLSFKMALSGVSSQRVWLNGHVLISSNAFTLTHTHRHTVQWFSMTQSFHWLHRWMLLSSLLSPDFGRAGEPSWFLLNLPTSFTISLLFFPHFLLCYLSPSSQHFPHVSAAFVHGLFTHLCFTVSRWIDHRSVTNNNEVFFSWRVLVKMWYLGFDLSMWMTSDSLNHCHEEGVLCSFGPGV